MNKTTKFINENSIEQILEYIKKNNQNAENVIAKSLQSRKEYGLKVQELVEILEGKRK